jgi:two-component system response regulator GlrR
MLRPRVLIVDDDRLVLDAARAALGPIDCDCRAVQGGRRALELAALEPPDLVLADLGMRGMAAAEFLEELRQIAPGVAVLLLVAADTAAGLDPGGCGSDTDFALKPVRAEEIAARTRRLLARRGERRTNQPSADVAMIGESRPMQELRRQIALVARTDTTVLVSGESGSGKELVARDVHRQSPRRDGPFVAVSASAIPPALLENEMFGHQAGSYTGALGASAGLFRAAARGTLFLDEVAELPLLVQAKLLRVLQCGEVRPLGASEVFDADVRVIAATNRDLRALVDLGQFRDDLYYRIHILPLAVPALRDRLDDLPLLATHLIERAAQSLGRDLPELTPEALDRLRSHPWPGNVRELDSHLRRLLLTAGPRIGAEDIRFEPAEAAPLRPFREAKGEVLERFEREYLSRALEAAGGNISEAARLAGKDRKDFWSLLKKHDITPAPRQPRNRLQQGETPLALTR